MKRTIDTILSKLPENNRFERIWKIGQVDFRKRYYNDRLGLIWALIRPIFEVFIYYFVFKFIFESTVENFELFLFLGLIIWMIFSETTSTGIGLLQSKNYLIENIQFNRLDLYISHLMSSLIGFAFNFTAFYIVALFYGIHISWEILWFPLILLIVLITSFGITLILSSLQPFLKDLVHLWDMILLAGLFGSGIFYDPSVLIKKATWLFYLNPFLGVMHNARAVILGTPDFDINMIYINIIQSVGLFVVGLIIFKKYGSLAVEKL